MSRQTVIKWEGNVIRPKADKLQLICDVLGVGLDFLMTKSLEDESSNNGENDKTEEVACDDATVNNVAEKKTEQAKKRKKRKLSKKSKITIVAIVLSIVIVIGIAIILIGNFLEQNNQGSFGGAKSSSDWYFSLENIGWIVFGISIGIAVIIGIILIYRFVRNKKIKKEENDVKS